MDLREIQELMKLLEASSLNELEIEDEHQRIRLSKGQPAPVTMYSHAAPAHAAPAPAMPSPVSAAPVADEQEAVEDDGLVYINSPMIGTYYSAAAPGEPPFVRVGERIERDQVVCIVEAMKIMNEVQAKETGILERILIENGEPVEFGQPLFALRTA